MKFRYSLALVLFLLGGCGPGGVSKRIGAGSGDEFRTSLTTSATTLDPAKVQDIDTTGMLRNIAEGLVSWDANNQLVGQLAESWSLSPDGKVYTFKLRKAQFSNGDPVTADDVKFSLERACSPALGSPTVSNYLDDIVGAKDVIKGTASSISGVKVVDPATLELHIEAPRAYFVAKLTYPCANVLSRKAGTSEISKPEALIATGPFKLAAMTPDIDVTLTPNEHYYGDKPLLKKVTYVVSKDYQTRLNKFRSGELLSIGVPRSELGNLKKQPDLKDKVVLSPRPAVAYLAMNQNGYAPFANPKIRQAIAMSLDRKYLVETLLGGAVPLANTILPPGIAGHRPKLEGIKFDPEAAKALLKEAGYEGGKGLPELQLTFRVQTPESKLLAEGIESQLRKNLGWTIKLREMEWGAMLKERNSDRLGFFLLSWYADYLDPQNFLSTLLTAKGGGNHFGYSNAKVDELCSLADASLDESKRTSLYQDAEDILLREGPWIPLYYPVEGSLQSPRLKGLQINLFGDLPYNKVSVTP